MTQDDRLARLDVSRQTTRGRACPNCGGKIIPSDRAVYQPAAGTTDTFPLWQCERCGYEEMGQKPKAPPKPSHPKKG
jgi:DNA-directed RNA polymerase subunit RPC12/RpoP